MLKKIACVTICVNDVDEAVDFYSDVFGLKPLWRDEQADSAGLLFSDTNAELVLVYDPQRPGQTEVHYLVDDVASAVQRYTEQGCIVLIQPFDTRMGKGSVIQDPFGIRLFLLDRSKDRAEHTIL
jgi:predicted enzyme related to lactoylglutathione lyase